MNKESLSLSTNQKLVTFIQQAREELRSGRKIWLEDTKKEFLQRPSYPQRPQIAFPQAFGGNPWFFKGRPDPRLRGHERRSSLDTLFRDL
jgi:hypothetical protein